MGYSTEAINYIVQTTRAASAASASSAEIPLSADNAPAAGSIVAEEATSSSAAPAGWLDFESAKALVEKAKKNITASKSEEGSGLPVYSRLRAALEGSSDEGKEGPAASTSRESTDTYDGVLQAFTEEMKERRFP